jgi:hypothetical protein
VKKIALLDELDADRHAIMSITSATQPVLADDNNTFANSGESGRKFICSPSRVGFPALSSASRR